MKIGIITPFPPYRGGISKHSENIYKELIKSSDITIFNFKRQYPDIIFPGKNQFSDNPNLFNSNNIIRIIDSINPISWNKTAKLIIEKKINRLIFRYWNPFFIPCYIYIIKYLKRKNYNIKFYSICDNAVSHENIYLQKYFMKKFIDHLDGIITMSSHVKNEIISLTKQEVNCRNIFLPILDDLPQKLDRNLARNQLNLSLDKKIFLFFGLIRDYKGIDILLESINNIDKSLYKKFKLLIVGENYIDIKKYKKIIDDSLKDNILWYNEYIPDKYINLYFSSSDYVVLPYKSGSQSGIIPMAYYYDKPVIVSDVNGLVELIDDNTGFIFKNKNINQLTTILENCIRSSNLLTVSYENIHNMKNKLSTKNYVQELLNFIK